MKQYLLARTIPAVHLRVLVYKPGTVGGDGKNIHRAAGKTDQPVDFIRDNALTKGLFDDPFDTTMRRTGHRDG